MLEKGYDRNWNIRDLLGDLMGAREDQPEPRDVIWASDLGKPYIDRWLQMKGVPFSNPPDGRGLMTFFLGLQIEAGIEEMLIRCGVAFRHQESVRVQMEGCLPVIGRADLVVEVRDWDEALSSLDDEPSEGDHRGREQGRRLALKKLLAQWRERCPQGLRATVFEVKSLNSAAFRHHRGSEGLSNAYPHHRLQLYTYLRGLGLDEGHLLYVARDTGWMEEVVIRQTEELDRAWLEDVETISRYVRTDERPPLEPRQVDGRDNWRVTYSRYRDYLYREVQDGAFVF